MLTGRNVLIVEAQYLIALDFETMLDAYRPARVVAAVNADIARSSQSDWHDPGLAVVEVEEHLPDQLAFAGELLRQDTPVVIVTADSDLPQKFSWLGTAPIIVKPVRSEEFIGAVEAVLKRSAPQNE